MRNFLRLKCFLIIVLTVLVSVSCNIDDGVDTIPIPDSTLVELIGADANLSTLVAALERADLVTTLQGNGPFTIFAPDNTAFTNFLGDAGFGSVDDVPVATLRQILLNHVVSGALDSAPLLNLQRNYLETLADGPTSDTKVALYFDAVNGITFNGISTITTADKPGSNGIYHIVDGVIALPTLATFIGVDQNFKSFDTALDLISPVSDLPNMLEEDAGPFTIFIPIEHAFDNLLASNSDWNFLSDINENLLNSIINHHVLNGNLRSPGISGGQTATTLEGDDITFVTLDGNLEITDGSGNEGAIIGITDIQALNGVIHGIPNKVLLPDTSN